LAYHKVGEIEMVTRIKPFVLQTGDQAAGAEASMITRQIFPTHVNSIIWTSPNPLRMRQVQAKTVGVASSSTSTQTATIEDLLPALPPDLPLPRFLVKKK
jgi:hypothetical protein